MAGQDIESLREMLVRERTSISIAEVKQIEFAPDNSVLRAKVLTAPEGLEVICRRAWSGAGPKAGIFFPLTVGDFVLVAYAGDEEDMGFIVAHLSSKEDAIPLQAKSNHLVLKCLMGKKILMGTAGDTEPTEPIVLGMVLKTLLSDILTELSDLALNISTHTHLDSLAAPTTVPSNTAAFVANKAVFDAKKASPVTDGMINSDVVFAEKGM